MAHGKTWTEEHKIYIATFRLGTLYSWDKIAEKVRARFGTTTTWKDAESHYNKGGIKPVRDPPAGKRTKGDILDDWRHYKTVPAEEQHVVDAARQILASIPAEDRLWE
jgi:hypothetical protein